ncbi:MAG TPA: ABC transporter permease subunit [Amaricoccus sp.]|uniref:ABC transporter permease n=1 Tax=Amaricoccus sp. TaxID=1872485 RepID=UPI002C2915CD|nr:ABC transporter permease subunit [Amaricoccus sp.]HMR52349.1 ABC transporter permease subunit [Amaricoccus sp.]HMR60171.1 ABC transporter permease subunit [Amaricoccus sp.]HMT99270.1 ABC transporter permease subunit [Amaricoccus sp.]
MTVHPDPTEALPVAVAGRSQWQDAWIRLRKNRAAVTSAIVLLVLGLIGIFGPMVWPHPHAQVYPQFVRVPASFEAYPRADTILPGFERELARTRLDHGPPVLEGDRVTVELTSDEPIDPRILRYFQRSDLFSDPSLELSEDELTGTLSAKVERLHFYFGTDAVGRDLAARIMIGVRISLAIGILASIMALLVGVTYGAVSGYLGGRVDNVMMRIVDILYSLPFIFFVILMVVFFGRSIVIIFIAIGATEWLDMARIVRGQTLSLKRQEFVQAAEALGATKAGILARHIIPNTLGPVVVFVTLLVPKAILLESLLSFLGLGVQEPLTSLGLLISEGASNMRGALWLLIWPAITLTLILFALNFLGDGLRDSLDPKDR